MNDQRTHLEIIAHQKRAIAKLLAMLEREHEALGCETDVTGQPCGTCMLIAAAKETE